jgi:biofilm protein TabA
VKFNPNLSYSGVCPGSYDETASNTGQIKIRTEHMIIDRLNNYHIYAYNDTLKAGFEFLKDLRKFPAEGRIEIRGDEIFANVDSYQTKLKSKCKMEAHKRYIDIQVLFSGEEMILWHPVSCLQEDVPYDDKRDVGFFIPPPRAAAKAILSKGIFMLFYPEDAHMPQIAVNNTPKSVRKIVVKIAV